MASEEIQLYNDIVKIGFPVLGTVLGGVIGAFSTYFITKLNHGNENKKEAIKKRHELILQTANDVTEFEHLIGVYVRALSKYIKNHEDSTDFEAAEQLFINRHQPLRRARMTLKVLGLSASESLLEEYIEITREILAKGKNLTTEKLTELAKTTSRGPIKFYESLASELSISTAI